MSFQLVKHDWSNVLGYIFHFSACIVVYIALLADLFFFVFLLLVMAIKTLNKCIELLNENVLNKKYLQCKMSHSADKFIITIVLAA